MSNASARRSTRLTKALLAIIIVAVAIVAYFTFRTTLQLERLRDQSVREASFGLAHEKAERLDRRIVEQDNVIISVVADPAQLEDLAARWIPTAQRETPTVRAVLVLDDQRQVVAFASRAASAWPEEESFRRLLIERMTRDMDLSKEPIDELRHLHHTYRGQSYLVSYWQRIHESRKYLMIAWHDVGRIVRELMPTLFAESTHQPRASVVDEEGRVIFGRTLGNGAYTVGVRFPTTLYGWQVMVSPGKGEELAARVENRRLLEIVMVLLSCVVIVLGVAAISVFAERERRMSAVKSEFVANVSHELKTPLALIRMFAEMLQTGRVASEEKRREYLDIVVSESERLTALIENVLDFARVEKGRQSYDFAKGNVGSAVTNSCTLYRVRAEREGRPIRASIEADLPDTWFDERAIQLAVMNLIDNALKYAHGADHIDVTLAREGTSLVVRVRDNGEGIDEDEPERLFERFFRGVSRLRNPSGGPIRGTGIGLALVKHVAKSHGGDAWVEPISDADAGSKGACFAFSVPIRNAAPEP